MQDSISIFLFSLVFTQLDLIQKIIHVNTNVMQDNINLYLLGNKINLHFILVL